MVSYFSLPFASTVLVDAPSAIELALRPPQ